jgi:hypothetical protein
MNVKSRNRAGTVIIKNETMLSMNKRGRSFFKYLKLTIAGSVQTSIFAKLPNKKVSAHVH